VVRFTAGPVVLHLVTDPGSVQQVMQTHNKNYTKQTKGFDTLRLLLGNGLLTSEGEYWLRQRRIAQPGFHRERITGFAQTMLRCTDEHLAGWETRIGEEVDVHAEMMKLTLRMASLTLMSADTQGQADEVGRALTVALTFANKQITRALPYMPRLPTAENRRLLEARGTLDRVINDIIAARRAGTDADDLLSMLMHARDEETGETMSDLQLRDELMTLFLAGHETTANALTWAFMLLSQYPAEARLVTAEVQSVLGDRPPTVGDLMKLPRLKRFIDEVLRLYPPAWSIGRAAAEDDELMGFHIPGGSTLIVNPFVTHRNPDVWHNPEGFDPDRFLPERVEKLPRFAYFPFGGGPRICIGAAFAQMELQIVLARTIQKLSLTLRPGHRAALDPVITLRPHGALPMRLHRA
jgi:cytochrome P450